MAAEAMAAANDAIAEMQRGLQAEQEAHAETEQFLTTMRLRLKHQEEHEAKMVEDAVARSPSPIAEAKSHPRWGLRPVDSDALDGGPYQGPYDAHTLPGQFSMEESRDSVQES